MSYAGWVTKSGNSVRSWKRRWMTLEKLEITYYPKKGAPPKGSFKLDAEVHAHELEHKRSPHMFGVSTAARTFVMYAENTQEKVAWIEAINEAVASMSQPKPGRKKTNFVNASSAGQKSPRGGPLATAGLRSLDDFLGLAAHLNDDQLACLRVWKRLLVAVPSTIRLLLYERAHQGYFEMLSASTRDTLQRLSEFLYICDTSSAELSLLDEFGQRFNPAQLGIWLRVSQGGALDGGWTMEFPKDSPVDLQEVLAVMQGDAPAALSTWSEMWGLNAFVTKITRDCGVDQPRALYVTFEFPGGKIADGCIANVCELIPSGVVQSDLGIMRMAEARGIQVGWTCNHDNNGGGAGKPWVFDVSLTFEKDDQVLQLLSEDFSGGLYRAGVVEWSVEHIAETT